MTLPRPNCSFTIPSLHDDLELNCRLYYPNRERKSTEKRYASSFAILAHPYAPLGGSYDDPVVALVGKVLLRQGYLLGTFNFRGAAESAGRSSWSGKAELADYVSFYAFMLSYLSSVFAFDTEVHSQIDRPLPVLVLGGYSYGSMMAHHLPSYDVVAAELNSAKPDSSANEIKRRAEHLAKECIVLSQTDSPEKQSCQNQSDILGADRSNTAGLNVTVMGGYESTGASRRISRESSRKSIDAERMRKSVENVRHKLRSRRIEEQEVESCHQRPPEELLLTRPRIAYLLVSPILPPIASFTTLFTKLSFESRNNGTHEQNCDKELVCHPSCAIYGSKDIFSSRRKLEQWSHNLSKQPRSLFSSHGIAGAGHFWHENGVALQLQHQVRDWLDHLEKSPILSS